MTRSQNPFGLHTLTPYMVVEDADRMIAFISEYFGGAVRGDIHYREDGTIRHSEMTLGDSVLMIGQVTAEFPDIRPTTTAMYVYVDDCDAAYKAALEGGAESIAAPLVYEHGDRMAGIRDFEGNSWWVVPHVGKPQQADRP